mmetsp:Transcript_128101/g.292747  ORF Transcript_128101/g.292747 Transcript_128101/m.292747 type:complete len:256 (-) Transcript_128101:1469-2236(-)
MICNPRRAVILMVLLLRVILAPSRGTMWMGPTCLGLPPASRPIKPNWSSSSSRCSSSSKSRSERCANSMVNQCVPSRLGNERPIRSGSASAEPRISPRCKVIVITMTALLGGAKRRRSGGSKPICTKRRSNNRNGGSSNRGSAGKTFRNSPSSTINSTIVNRNIRNIRELQHRTPQDRFRNRCSNITSSSCSTTINSSSISSSRRSRSWCLGLSGLRAKNRPKSRLRSLTLGPQSGMTSPQVRLRWARLLLAPRL